MFLVTLNSLTFIRSWGGVRMFLVTLNSLTFIRSWGGCHSVPKGGAHETPVFRESAHKSDFVNFKKNNYI